LVKVATVLSVAQTKQGYYHQVQNQLTRRINDKTSQILLQKKTSQIPLFILCEVGASFFFCPSIIL